MERIRVELERSGGFGGLTLRSHVDTDELSIEERRELVILVDALETSNASKASPSSVPDSTRYDLTIVRGGDVRQISFDDTTVPREIRPLLDRLTRPTGT